MSGRYQSKLFNFLSRQSVQLRHQSAQTWRQAKVAAVWGVQILLYPVYVAFQSTRLAGRQLRQATGQAVPRLRSAARALQAAPPLPADAPIQSLLQSLSQLTVSLPSAPAPDLSLALAHSAQQPHRKQTAEVLVAASDLTASLQVRGIASQLGTGSLVLVTSQNQTLDILTPMQQTQLTQRIAWELASYWRQQRQLQVPAAPPLSRYLPLPKPQQNALPPVRAWRGLMAWMQRSSVAVSADLFQESRHDPAALLPSASPELRSAQPAWEAAEAQFYRWLADTGQSASSLLTAGWESAKTALAKRSLQEGVSQFRALLPAARANALPAVMTSVTPAVIPAVAAPTNHPAQIPADWLLKLDRWLSAIPGLGAAPASPDQLNASATPQALIRPRWPDGWLKHSLRDLLAQPQGSEADAWEMTDTAVLEEVIKQDFQRQPASYCPSQPGALSAWDADYGMGRPLRRRSSLDAPLTSLDTANAEEAAMVPQSWIETEAQLVEYVKHPLEQILAWLDQGMLWVEQRLSKLWQLLNRPIF